ncbi:hypothetical protein EV356DRAFT_527823 [Viridothelium virens]|uniref:Rax2-like second domain-containing protein n=1 Tax=Viridothelium virens TaxID=1048519 RepID=A0A6A6HQ54_VIRVR|nr:hypothetical protein EV356DRAFT_527823 [Viridothelium virens]
MAWSHPSTTPLNVLSRRQSVSAYPISLSSATIIASNTQPGMNPSDLANNQTWLLQDNTAGSIQFEWARSFQPTRLLLNNTEQDDRGTKTFFLTNFDNGAIMNLTFTDPITGEQETCTQACPLPQDNTTWQEFDWVNESSTTGFVIHIQDWYGSGGGFDGVQVFQNNKDLIEPSPSSSSTGSASSTSTTSTALASSTTSAIGTAPATSQASSPNSEHKDGVSSGAKAAGITVGVLVGVAILVAILVWLFRRKRRARHKPDKDSREGYEKAELGDTQVHKAELDPDALVRHEVRAGKVDPTTELPATSNPVELPS